VGSLRGGGRLDVRGRHCELPFTPRVGSIAGSMTTAFSARPASSLEVLETRIAPAAIVTFTDLDGDRVTVSSSRGTTADLNAVVQPFLVATGLGFQLQQIALASAPAIFQGTTLVVSAAVGAGGDGRVDVGYLNATGLDLNSVTIDGDLGQIDAGDANVQTPALRSLSAVSLGARGLATQAAGGGSLVSTIFGGVGALVLSGDLRDATFQVLGSVVDPAPLVHSSTDAAGKIGAVRIAGSVLGGATAGSGQIFAKGRIGSLFIGGNLAGGAGAESGRIWTEGGLDSAVIEGSILGGTDPAASHSGVLFAGGKSAKILVKGELRGGAGADSGVISNGRGLGSVTVLGGLDGGAGDRSGTIASGARIGLVSISGGVLGGSGEESGVVRSKIAIQTVKIIGDLRGGSGDLSGVIGSAETIGSVTVAGSVIGGIGSQSGAVGSIAALGDIRITGDLRGGSGPRSGQIVSATSIRSVTVGGSVVGGAAFESGAIGSLGTLGAVRIGADLLAGAGAYSGTVLAGGPESGEGSRSAIASVTIGGDLDGTPGSGVVGPSAGAIFTDGALGPVIVRGSVRGGAGDNVGSISGETIRSVRIDGDLLGGSGEASGLVLANSNLGPVTIAKSVRGGSGESSGALRSGGRMGTVQIGGTLTGGTGDLSGTIETQGEPGDSDMGAVRIVGAIVGGVGRNSGSIHSSGQLASVEAAEMRGYSGTGGLTVGLGSGSISSELDLGPVKIAGSITGGTGDESGKITSGGKLARLTVGGSITGGSGAFDTTAQDLREIGQVFALNAIGPVRITGSLTGGAGAHSGEIRGGALASVTLGGQLRGGSGVHSGGLTSTSGDIGPVVIGGALESGSGLDSGFIMAADALTSLRVDRVLGGPERVLISALRAIGTVTVANQVAFTDIFAGLDLARDFTRVGASIGTVTIGAHPDRETTPSILATNIVASARPGADGDFGTPDDLPLSSAPGSFSRIGAVIVRGSILDPGDLDLEVRLVIAGSAFGIVADHVVQVIAAGQTIPQRVGPGNDFLPLRGSTLAINELALD